MWQLSSFFKQHDYAVDFLFYPFEGEWNERIPPEVEDMRRAWDSFWIVPPTIRLHQPAVGSYHEIDEWWDDSIGNFLTWLFARRTYEVFVVNYTFLSKAFTLAPKSVVRVLETHDKFSGRKEMLASLGVEPEFYYTTEENERAALDRADIVVAIKESEARLFQTMTNAHVIGLPFFPSKSTETVLRDDDFRGLSVGFIGALNSVNSANMQLFLEIFDRQIKYYCPPLRFLIAGDVCFRLSSSNPAIKLLGKLPNLNDFYSLVDVIVAPMVQSTGIKIKVGEALGFGKGVVSTSNGFDGYPAIDPMHALSSLSEVGRALVQIACDEQRREQLIRNSQLSARLAARATAVAFRELDHAIRSRSRRVVLICDEAFWGRANLHSTRLEQWLEFCQFLMRVLILVVREQQTPALPEFKRFDFIEEIFVPAGDPSATSLVSDKLGEMLQNVSGANVMLSMQGDWGPQLVEELADRGYTVVADLWRRPLADAARRAGVNDGADLWAVRGKDHIGVETTLLRYAPATLVGWRDRSPGKCILLVAVCPDLELDAAVLEIREAMRQHDLDLQLLRASDQDEAIELLYQDAQTREPPSLLLSISKVRTLNSFCQFLARLGRIQHWNISADQFPMALPHSDGDIRFLGSRRDLLDCVLNQQGPGHLDIAPYDANDGGWSKLWSLLETGRAPADREGLSQGGTLVAGRLV